MQPIVHATEDGVQYAKISRGGGFRVLTYLKICGIVAEEGDVLAAQRKVKFEVCSWRRLPTPFD